MNMISAYTPGPWRARAAPRGDLHTGPVVDGPDGERIASVIYAGDSETSNGNARLIAAAPGLVAACRGALALLQDPDAEAFDADKVEQALAAVLAKAGAHDAPRL